jgi:aquaporin Z
MTTTHTHTTSPNTTQAVARLRKAAPYVVEAIGTLFLVFTVGATVRAGNTLAPFATGGVLAAMIYAGGHVSGAHYNPAVTFAVLVRGRIRLREAAGYWLAQTIGGLLAAAAVTAIIPRAHTPSSPEPGPTIAAIFIAEVVFTFALAYVVLNVATSRDHPDNSFYGLAIGAVVLAGALAVGPVSGGAFNPAVVLGGAAMGMFAGSPLWVYVVAQLVAGGTAGAVFRALNPDDI